MASFPAITRLLAAASLLALLAACAGTRPDQRALEKSLYDYAGAIRWGELDTALLFLDPDKRAEQPLSALDRERFKQIAVTGYYVRGRQPVGKDGLKQVVEIRLVNRHTQVERSLVDRQSWRWDAEARRWWLTTGLPDIAQAR